MATIVRSFWKPAGGVYLAFCLAGLAVGLWPQAIHPPDSSINPAPLPVLSSLATAQAAYLLVVWPIVMARRYRRGVASCIRHDAAETLGLLLTAAPLYIMAAWFSDAVIDDVIRVAVLLVCVAPLCWLLGRLLAGPRSMPWALLAALLLAVGLPLLHYVLMDFAASVPSGWAWAASPVSLAWSAGQARGEGLLPSPLWAPLGWLTAAGIGCLGRRIAMRRPATEAPGEL